MGTDLFSRRSGVNRDYLRDYVSLMCQLVPLIVATMMDHPGTQCDDAYYPGVGYPRDRSETPEDDESET